MSQKKKKIVIIGGGFGGLAFAKACQSPAAEITLLDKSNHHLFQPLLYQVATCGLAEVDIAQTLREILSSRKDIRVTMDEVTSIDLKNKTVHTFINKIPYDYLVIAAGGETSYFGNNHWKRYAFGLKSLTDASQIRNQFLSSLEKAESSGMDRHDLNSFMTVAIIGAGPSGVELAGSLAELTRRVLPGDFKRIQPKKARVILVEAMDKVLPPFPDELSRKAQAHLEELGVEIQLGQMVQDIRSGEVELANGEVIHAATICWTAGIRANSLTKSLDLPKDKAGKIKVEKDCSLPGHPEAFAIGDLIHLEDAEGKPVPGVAQGALQTGKHVAKIIKDELSGHRSRKPFVYKDRGEMATVGRSKAVARIGNRMFSGLFAWLAWSMVHLVALVGLKNRVAVLFNWLASYALYQPRGRIISDLPQNEKSKSE